MKQQPRCAEADQ